MKAVKMSIKQQFQNDYKATFPFGNIKKCCPQDGSPLK